MISVTYAGAGGGKTTSMVASIRSVLKDLHPNRYICVITYTNEAANDIKLKLNEQQKIPDNIFIGTIHGFLLRFVIKPHFVNGGELSVVSQIKYGEDALAGFIGWAKKKFPNIKERNIKIANERRKIKERIYTKLLQAHLITYDQIIQQAKILTDNAFIRKAIARKIQFLFVDEYQDTYKWQHDVFEAIHKCKMTDWHVIGDPNQSIYSFTYGTSENEARKPKKYDDFPICKLRNSCNPENYNENIVNYRSSQEIVNFANLYNKDFQQKSNIGIFSSVVAFQCHEPIALHQAFHQRRKQLGLDGSIFYLSRKNSNLEQFKIKIGNENPTVMCIRSVEDCILQISGFNLREFCEVNKVSRFQFRTLAILCQSQVEITIDVIKSLFQTKFGSELKSVVHDIEAPIALIMPSNHHEKVLTIHKSKGLEAESVLVVFDTNKNLNKILTERNLMKSIDTDDLRLGYVAFTRAKKFLAICCLEALSEENKNLLTKDGVQLI